MTKKQSAERDEAIASLRETLKPGDTVYTVLKSVSRSGMSRVIQVYAIQDNEPRWLTYLAHKAGVGSGYDERREGIKMGGCGMDMGFALVYELSSTLWPDGFECCGEKCVSNDHSNGDWNRAPHHHDSGGYALRHRWM